MDYVLFGAEHRTASPCHPQLLQAVKSFGGEEEATGLYFSFYQKKLTRTVSTTKKN
jgi:hypothetical protein